MPLYVEIVTLCHSAMVHDGRLSILGAFSVVHVNDFPFALLPPLAVAFRVRLEDIAPGQHKIKFTVADTDGRVLVQGGADISQTKEAPHRSWSACIAVPTTGMELRCAGEHVIDLILDGEEPVRTPFRVLKV